MDNGLVGRTGLLDSSQFARAGEIIAALDSDDIETARVVFADQHGVLRGKTLVSSALESVFRDGMAVVSTLLLKDTSHRTVFPVWEEGHGAGGGLQAGAGDLLIVPDPATFRILPWSPHSGWILCNVVHKDGRPFPFCSRTILQNAIGRLDQAGMTMKCGLEVEFFVFKVDDPRLAHDDGGMPAAAPETSLITHGYQLNTESRFDALEDIMDLLRRNCVKLDLPLRSMEAEFGPSQCEFTFEPDGPLQQADAMMLFRSMVKQVCARQGLHATFMCRPKLENGMASGWHLHQSILDARTGVNLFVPPDDDALTDTASGWIAGLLEHAAESCLLTTPTVNGYKRYQPFQLAPERIQWGRDNKGAMIRGLMVPEYNASRIENRVAEPAANPYLFLASQILSGLDGVTRKLEAPLAVNRPYDSSAASLPRSLVAAIERFESGAFYRQEIGTDFVAYLAHIKRAEWDRYLMTVSDWEQREYFSLF